MAKGNSKLIVEIHFKGARRGVIYFVGTPVYNPATNLLSVPDLDFSLQTKSLLLKVAAWILNAQITTQLRNAAQYDLSVMLGGIKTTIQNDLTKQISPGISSACTINSLTIKGLFPTADNLIVRPVLSGKLSVEIK